MRSGSTLIELTILLAILAIVGAIAVPQAYKHTQRAVRSHAQLLCAEIRKHQQYAQIGNQELCMRFDASTHSYHSPIGQHTLPNGIRFGTMPGALGPPSAPTKPIQSAISFPNNRIRFHANGTIDSGALYLVDSSRTIMYAITIGVAHVPFTRIYQYTGQWKPIS